MNLGAVSTLIFDLDGVVWRGDTPIDSAISAINDLRRNGKRCLFCTNNSSQTQAAFVSKLAGMGIEGVAEDEIITSSSATAIYLSAQYTGPFLAYVVGGEGIHLALQKIGARIVPDSDITENTNVDCVVAGIDRAFNYEKLSIAQRLIGRGALFVATNRDATYPIENGVIPGAGAIISAIETASGSTPVTIGKPRPVMVQLVMQKYNLKAEEIAVIGDRLDTDIVCAKRAGVAALLVTTGVTTLPQARRAKGEMRPDAVFPDLTSFAEIVLNNSPAAPLETDDLPSVVAVGMPAIETSPIETFAMETPFVETPASETFSIETPLSDLAGSTPDAIETPFANPTDAASIMESPSLESPTISVGAAPVEETDAIVWPDESAEETIPFPAPDNAFEVASPAVAPDGEKKVGDWDDTWFTENSGDQASDAIVETPAPDAPVVETSVVETPVEEKREESTPAAPSGAFDWKLD